jgi:hypothetical protein
MTQAMRDAKLPMEYHLMSGYKLCEAKTAWYTHEATSRRNVFNKFAKAGTMAANMDMISRLRILIWMQTRVIIDACVLHQDNPHCLMLSFALKVITGIFVHDEEERIERRRNWPGARKAPIVEVISSDMLTKAQNCTEAGSSVAILNMASATHGRGVSQPELEHKRKTFTGALTQSDSPQNTSLAYTLSMRAHVSYQEK